MNPEAVLDPIRAEVDTYLDLLFRWSRAVRLTALRTRKEALRIGVLPSLEALPLLPPGPFEALDVGSGGGFPAIPLALARREGRWTLTEPSGRKAAFLREAARVLDLPLEVRDHSAEEALSSGAGPFAAVTVRGVRITPTLLSRLAGGLVPGGTLLVWTSRDLAAPLASSAEGLGLAVRRHPLQVEGLDLVRGTRG